jgi:hypothetical protein
VKVPNALAFAACLLLLPSSSGQGVLGVVSGRVTDAGGVPLNNAEAFYHNAAVTLDQPIHVGPGGRFTLPLLPPGVYTFKFTAAGYQTQEIDNLDLPVGAFMNLAIHLRSLQDLWEQRQLKMFILPGSQVVTFYGPDVDISRVVHVQAPDEKLASLDPGMSDVIDTRELANLPLAGRDTYTGLLLQPAVSADVTAGRGIGLSAAGQRVSSSNFLLDGLENNNYTITGPLSPLPPEAMGEYRISTNNYSAEFGRTNGFIANAITKPGTDRWHGLGYLNLENASLNADDFQSKAQNISRQPGSSVNPGFQIGGPLFRDILFGSFSFDDLHTRGVQRGGPEVFSLPTQGFYADLPSLALSAGRDILLQYRPQFIPEGSSGALTATVALSPSVTLDRQIGLARFDFVPINSRNRFMGRIAEARISRPDYNWSPYPQFTTGFDQSSDSVAASITTRSINGVIANDARVGWNRSLVTDTGTRSMLPEMRSSDGVALPGPMSSIQYLNGNRSAEFADTLVWVKNRHLIKAGGGFILRWDNLDYQFAAKGLLQYQNLSSFLQDSPLAFESSFSRQQFTTGNIASALHGNGYRENQYDAFVQDNYRPTSRLTLSIGFRVDHFGSPRAVSGAPSPLVVFGQGTDIQQRIASARIDFGGPANGQIYHSDNLNPAVRAGFSFSPTARGDTSVRGGYGIFYDRTFDNIWQDVQQNTWVIGGCLSNPCVVNPFDPRLGIQALAARYQPQLTFFGGGPTLVTADPNFVPLTLIQPHLRSPYTQTAFLSIDHRLSHSITIYTAGLLSLGRELIANDIINRFFSLGSQYGSPSNFNAQLNGNLPELQYRSNQGSSGYSAFAIRARYRSTHFDAGANYTWSHAIDNQSDPLNGDFTDLRTSQTAVQYSTFVRQFDSRSDRSSSDFDQRHVLIFDGSWSSGSVGPGPRNLLSNWRLSALGALRTGFPFSVYAQPTEAPASTSIQFCTLETVLSVPACGGEILANRPSLVAAGATTSIRIPSSRGVLLLNPAAFQTPNYLNEEGNTGRNAFTAPGTIQFDLSMGRSFAFPFLTEGRITVRADAYNVLNHANLGPPNPFLGSPSFGLALFGQRQQSMGLPPILPLVESPRVIQLLLRIEF